MTDAVVVGSGPNGLAAAVTLAAAGVSVTVVEAADRIGGGTRSSELTLPGLLHDECSGFHPFALGTPFSRFAGLDRFGLRWAWPEVQYTSPLPGGGGGAAYRDVEATADGLGADGTTWRRIFGPLAPRFDVIADDFLGPVISLPRHPIQLARFGLRAGLPATTLIRRFPGAAGRALYAGVAAHAIHPLSAVLSSAIGVALGTAAHTVGWPVAVGGSRSISDAMAAALRANGGRIETGRPVTSLAELGSPTIVMLDVAPSAAVRIAGPAMPDRVRRAYARFRHGPGAHKVDLAVEGGIPWLHEPSRRAGTVHVGGTAEETVVGEADLRRGRLPERPFVLVGQQYLADPSRSHADVHPVWAYAHVPAGFTGDATALLEQQIERVAPGFRDRIIARSVRSARDMAADNANYVGGDVNTGLNSPRQLVFRPRIGLDPYSVGVDGVFLCSAATPPGAGAHGMCGYHAARRALRHLGLDVPAEPAAR